MRCESCAQEIKEVILPLAIGHPEDEGDVVKIQCLDNITSPDWEQLAGTFLAWMGRSVASGFIDELAKHMKADVDGKYRA